MKKYPCLDTLLIIRFKVFGVNSQNSNLSLSKISRSVSTRSYLTVTTNQDWCEQNAVSLKSYYYWLAKIRKLALEDLPRKQYASAIPAGQRNSELSEHQATFTELLLPNTAALDHNAAAILHIGSVTVEIFEYTSSELISSIVKAVQPC